MKRSLGLLFVLILTVSSTSGLARSVEVGSLSCEYKDNPIGIHTTEPRLSWKLTSDELGQKQTAYQVLVASDPSLLNEGDADLWNTGKVVSDQSIQLVYAGEKLKSRQRCWWKVRVWDAKEKRSKWSSPAYFEIGLLDPGDWQASWISSAISFEEYRYPSPLIRKEFELNKKVKSARLYSTSLGLYEFYLNGEKIGEDLFTPGYTSYDNRLQYQVYDITSLLRSGSNATGVMLGNGWYRGFNPNNLPLPQIDKLEVLAQLEIEFTDGTSQIIPTDLSWKSSTGALLESDILYGETYDAGKEQSGWKTAGFDDSLWKEVSLTGTRKDFLVGTTSEPVRRINELEPIEIIYTPQGDTVLDMGQNMVGWVRLKVNTDKSTKITLKHAEVLDNNGNFYIENLRGAVQEVTYITKGSGEEVYEPHFTFQGFRYVAISGYQGVSKETLTGIVIHSDLPRIGTFSCNNELINQLQHNIIWGQKGNFLDVPTDCPQRDERLGWTGDAQVFAPTACFNMQTANFFTKWLKDLAADQHEDGAVPNVIPNQLRRGGAHGWGDAAVIVPWNLYLTYGDKRVLSEQYESMKAWIEFIRKEAGENYIWKPKDRQFGDWLAFATKKSDYPGATTDKDLTANAYFYHSTGLLSKSARILGKTGDADFYDQLKDKVKEAFVAEFITPNGRLSSNTQTAYVVALSFGLVPEDLEYMAAQRLADDVNKFGHITTGFLGTADICHVLTKYGHLEEAYKLIYRKEYPSWLYPVTKGATTIWERWDGIQDNGAFQSKWMNSFNHYAYGAVGGWLYRKVAGINADPEVPGYKKIIIKPYPFAEMNDVKSTHESPYGQVSSEWSVKDTVFTLTVTIPPNTTADIYVPSTSGDVMVNGKKSNGGKSMTEKGVPYQFVSIPCQSGTYQFNTTLDY